MTSPSPESATPSLLATIAQRLTGATVLDLMGSESKAVRQIATEWLLRRLPDETERILLRGLDRDARICHGVLQAMRHPGLEVTEIVHRRVLRLLEASDGPLRSAVVGLIVRRWPEDSCDILAAMATCLGDESLRALCLAGDPRLILVLLNAYGFPSRMPPPTIGFLVTPTWLAESHGAHPQAVEWLARECGYCAEPVTREIIEMLSLGFSFVAEPLTPAGPADRWLERVRSLSWRLLPETDDASYRDTRPLDLNDPLETVLFLNAVRETDRLQFAAHRMDIPSRRVRDQGDPSPVCFHANPRYVRRLFLTDAHVIARELRVPDELLSEFVLGHARVVLETTPERRTVADRRFRTRWQLRLETELSTEPGRSRGSQEAMNAEIWPTSRRRRGLHPVRNPTEARRLVIGGFEPSSFDRPLSPGAQSVCRLAELAGLDAASLACWLSERESRWSRSVVPIGIELQIPKVDPNLFGPWKDALSYLGIPSPHRPEFGGMLEAALRPARSFHAILFAPPLLHALGVISKTQPQDIAVHVSLQGDLRSDARYLAFPQLFIHPSQRLRNRPDAAMTRVMSKGLVHRNCDIERLSPEPVGQDVRTELRMFRLFCDEGGAGTLISPTYMEDLLAAHLIGSAMLAECQPCQEVAAAYGREIEMETAQLPVAFARLLHSNFYESTGDPHDEVLLQALPIFRAWSEVRRTVRERNLPAELETTFCRLRSQHVRRLSDHLRDKHGLDVAADLECSSEWIRKLGMARPHPTLW